MVNLILNSRLYEAGDEDVGGEEGGYAKDDEATFLCRREERSVRGLTLFVGLYVESGAEEVED